MCSKYHRLLGRDEACCHFIVAMSMVVMVPYAVINCLRLFVVGNGSDGRHMCICIANNAVSGTVFHFI